MKRLRYIGTFNKEFLVILQLRNWSINDCYFRYDMTLDCMYHYTQWLYYTFQYFISIYLYSLYWHLCGSNGYFTLNMCLFLIKIRYFPKHNKQHLYYSCQLTYDVNKQKLYIILLDTFPPLCNWLTGTSNECRICHKYTSAASQTLMYISFCEALMWYLQIFFGRNLFSKYPIIHKYLDINL